MIKKEKERGQSKKEETMEKIRKTTSKGIELIY